MINQDLSGELTAAAEFRAALRAFLRRTADASAANGLTAQRYDLLLQIGSGDGESTVTELTERLAMPQPAVTELVNRAVQARLVRRRRDPSDRRVSRLRLTPRGERLLLATFDELRVGRRELLDAFAHVARTLQVSRPRSRTGRTNR